MPDRKRTILILATLVATLAACGGSAASPGAQTSGPTQPAASDGPTDAPSSAASEEPGETPAETTTGGGGGGDSCSLVTVEEAGSILGASGVTADLTPGDFSYCFYRDSNGDAIAASSYSARGGGAIFNTWAAGAGVQPVDGIGDAAVFDPSSATLFVNVGDAIYGITAGISSDAEAQRRDWAEEFGKIAAGRM